MLLPGVGAGAAGKKIQKLPPKFSRQNYAAKIFRQNFPAKIFAASNKVFFCEILSKMEYIFFLGHELKHFYDCN